MPTINAPAVDAPTVEWALWWASRGWMIFPLCSPEMGPHRHRKSDKDDCDKDLGKGPLIATWKAEATADKGKIKGWWTQWPTANIGARPPADHFVVDIDGPTDTEFPDTWEHSTGKGRHLVYRQNITKPVDQTSQTLWPNVDTRTHEKGYVVLPPSRHRSGNVYTLVRQTQPIPFPAELVPNKRTKAKELKAGDSDVVKLLLAPRDSDELGDDAMTKVAGFMARYLPDRETYAAVIGAINLSLAEPLDETAMTKKLGIWDKHKNNQEEKQEKALDDESRGWLFELAGTGYHTEVGSGDNLDYVEFSDFRVTAKGLVVKPDNHVLIVDFHKADGTTLENVHVSASILTNNAKLREFCARRGMAVYTNRGDKRSDYGMRLFKYLMSQEPPHLDSTEFYGWNDESQTFICDDGEVTVDGDRQEYSKVFPEQNLTTNRSVHYGFDYSEDEVKDLFSRTLALNEPLEMAKLGSWMVMMALKGQWQDARLPGVITSAFSGTGKSSLYEVVTAWLGYRQKGGKITGAVMRNMLAKSNNSAVWLDDFELDDTMKATMRSALTTGSESKMVAVNGDFVDTVFPLRGSIIVTDEGNALLHEKANADRFMKVDLKAGHRSTDIERLKSLDMSNGAGTFVQLVMKHRHHLDQLPELLSQATDRAGRWRALIVVGSRILSEILGDDRWSNMVREWAEELSGSTSQASMLVHQIIPTIWMGNGMQTTASIQPSVFYDENRRVFWVNVQKLSEAWRSRFGLSKREQQLGTPEAIKAELEACGSHGQGKGKGPRKLRYQELPASYSAIAFALCEVGTDDEENHDDDE